MLKNFRKWKKSLLDLTSRIFFPTFICSFPSTRNVTIFTFRSFLSFNLFFHHCNERTALKAFCKRGYRLSLIKRKTEIFGATTMPESLRKIAKVGFNFFPSFFFCDLPAASKQSPCLKLLDLVFPC